jgi:hypothetical protein
VLCVIQFIAPGGTIITFSSFQQIAASRGVCPATHNILRMPHGVRLMVRWWYDEGGGPVVGLAHGASVTTSWNTDRKKLVRNDA